MLELAGPLAVVALVLVASGSLTLREPGARRRMLEAVVGRANRSLGVLAVLTAVLELALGVAMFLWGGRILASAAAGAFAVFAGVTWLLVRSGATTSCGCFGRRSGEATSVHVGVDAGLAVLATVAAAGDAPGFLDARADLPAGGIPFVGLAALGAWLAVAAMTVLPAALAAARRQPAAARVRSFEVSGAP